MKIRTSNGIKLDKLEPGAILVVEGFGHVVLKKTKFSEDLNHEIAYGVKGKKRLRKLADMVEIVVYLPNVMPGHSGRLSGGLIDDRYPVLRTGLLAKSVLEVVSEKKLAKRKLVVAEAAIGPADQGCSGGCAGGGCSGSGQCKHHHDDDHEDADGDESEDLPTFHGSNLSLDYFKYLSSSLSGLQALNLPRGFGWSTSLDYFQATGSLARFNIVRHTYYFPPIFAKLVDGKFVHSLTPTFQEPLAEPLADIVRRVIEKHAAKKGVAALRFDGTPWVK